MRRAGGEDRTGLPDGGADRGLFGARRRLDPGPSPAGKSEIGGILRQARERAGHGLEDASGHLRIRLAYLRALESGDFAALPGRTYAIGFVRGYARFLGLDEERAIALFKAETAELETPRALVFPAPAPEGKVPGGAIVAVAAALLVAVYGGWYYLNASDPEVAEVAPTVPEASRPAPAADGGTGGGDGFAPLAHAAPAPEPADAARPEPPLAPAPEAAAAPAPEPETPALAALPPATEVGAAPPPAVPAAPAPAATDAGIAGAPNPDAAAGAAAGGPAPVPLPVARAVARAAEARIAALEPPEAPADAGGEGIPDAPAAAAIPAAPAVPSAAPAAGGGGGDDTGVGGSRVVIRASADSWVQVRASDSTTVMTRVMREGESYNVPDREGLRLFTGNAGALTILVDGRPVGSLGEVGHVARNIDLDPARLARRIEIE